MHWPSGPEPEWPDREVGRGFRSVCRPCRCDAPGQTVGRWAAAAPATEAQMPTSPPHEPCGAESTTGLRGGAAGGANAPRDGEPGAL
eukprot:scaffold4745_cov125-Isochrysis_galbana.AAC.9